MTVRTWLSESFHHLVPNDNLHCQTPLKNAKFDLFGSEKCQLVNLVANTDGLVVAVHTGYGSGNSKQLKQHDSNICRRFIPATAFLVVMCS